MFGGAVGEEAWGFFEAGCAGEEEEGFIFGGRRL